MERFGSAIILCGGKSSRMGFDKCKIKVNGKYLIDIIAGELEKIFDEIILVTDDSNKFIDFDYRVVEDFYKNCGPAGAIYTGIKSASSNYVFVTACDMPFINIYYIDYIMKIIEERSPDCVISKNGEWIEPLYAFYSKMMLFYMENSIRNNCFKLFEIIKKSNTCYIEEETVRSYSRNLEIFYNLNYIEDVDNLKKYFNCEDIFYE